MAECVSCGKPVETGKLFCDQCYARMKGRRASLREAGVSRERGKERAGLSQLGESRPWPAAFPDGVRMNKDSLTPASEKKVVRLRPEVEKPTRTGRKSRFVITITFSERTYRMLNRLRLRDKGAEGGGAEVVPVGPGRIADRRRKGPHGRPALKALKGVGTPARAPGKRGGFVAWTAYRSRRLDAGDLASLGMAALSVIMILGLTFVPWVRITWITEGGKVAGETPIRGWDLGAITYLSLALVLVAAVYVPLSLRFGERLGHLDYGLVLLVAGLIFVILFYVNISSNQRMVDLALRLAGGAGGVPGDELERHTSWTAYLVSFMGLVLAFSGLMRLSERSSPQAEENREVSK
ncbi:MAG: hypothetical protein ACUVS1_05855 [Actinomycetota bacterium]